MLRKSKDRQIVKDDVVILPHREIVEAEYWEEEELVEAVLDSLPATLGVELSAKKEPLAPILATDETLYRAAVAGNRSQVIAGLADLTHHSTIEIEFVLQQQKPKVVVALCWAAGVSAATAFHVQVKIAGIPARQAIAPDGDGYGVAVPALEWYRDFYERLLVERR